MSTPVEITLAGGVQTIRLNRPDKKNALTLPMYQAMTEALAAANADPAIAVSVFEGLPGAFCAGNDIEDFLGFARSGELGAPILAFLRALVAARKPLIAAVDGLAIGIGTTLLFHCDLAFATPNAVFKTPFVDLALVPEAASSLLAPRLMGQARAFELLALGAPFDAAKAERVGLVNAVVAADDLSITVARAALALAQKPPGALAAARALIRGDTADILARIDQEAAEFAARLRSGEAREAFTAFLEKRKPDFSRFRG